jgi:hypothetical protein
VDPVCLFVAATLVATLPQREFVLAWTHSVQKTRWTERYRVDDDAMELVEATVEGSGAGMEPGPGVRLEHGEWTWQPRRRVASLALRRSTFTDDYAICVAGRCRPMAELAGPPGPDAVVIVAPCNARPR